MSTCFMVPELIAICKASLTTSCINQDIYIANVWTAKLCISPHCYYQKGLCGRLTTFSISIFHPVSILEKLTEVIGAPVGANAPRFGCWLSYCVLTMIIITWWFFHASCGRILAIKQIMICDYTITEFWKQSGWSCLSSLNLYPTENLQRLSLNDPIYRLGLQYKKSMRN